MNSTLTQMSSTYSPAADEANNGTASGTLVIDHEQELLVMTWISCGFTSLMCLYIVMLQIGYRLLNSARSMIILIFLAMTGTTEVCYVAGITSSDIPAVCTTMAALFHFSCVSCFTWLLSYILFLGNKLHTKALSVGLYAVIGWAIPACFVCISVVWKYQNYRQAEVCWISSDDYLDWALKGPIIIFLFFSVVILLHVLRMYLVLRKDFAQAKKLKYTGIDIFSCIILLPVMGVTWLFGVFSATDGHLWLRAAFTVSNIVMGGLLFFYMCLFDQEIHHAREKYSNNSWTFRERIFNRKKNNRVDRDNMLPPKPRATVMFIRTTNAKLTTRESIYRMTGDSPSYNKLRSSQETSLVDTDIQKDQDVSHLFKDTEPVEPKLTARSTKSTAKNNASTSKTLYQEMDIGVNEGTLPPKLSNIPPANIVHVNPLKAPIARSEMASDVDHDKA